VRLTPTSLRGRLAVFFALGAAALVVAASALLYLTLESQLDGAIRDGLQGRVDDIGAEVRAGRVVLPQEESFAQLLSPTGTAIDTSATRAVAPVLRPRELEQALRHEVLIDRRVPDLPGLGRRARFLARPVPGPDGPVVIVVGASLDAVDRGRNALGVAFAVAGPVLVGALGAGGWLLAGAALRPVEHMTEEADAISLTEPGRRLPQPPGDDEIAHLARTLNAMLERIEATFARERTFLDDASHELRTPISILRGELELALLDASDAAATRLALQSALEEAERLSRLADDLLILARASAGRLPLRCQPADLRALVGDVAARLGRGTGLVVDPSGEPVPVAVDPTRLEQVVANLLTNARRHARQQVRAEVTLEHHEATVTVADDGPGFPPSLLPVVFDRFTRGDPARHHQDDSGAGLGLAIAAALVRAHGGTIEAANGPPLGGAVVRVRLPALD
jgi:signal transduction histidine kinase